MKDEDKYSLFGVGFVLGEYAKTYPDEVICIDRESRFANSNNILYGRSTVHNYHPKEGDPFIDIRTNLLHFMQVLDLNINEDVTFNLISTFFVYGQGAQLPAKEDSPCNPSGFYSITANAREQLLRSYCGTFGLKYRILRLCNILGTGDKKASPKKNALQWMIKELAEGKEIKIYKGDNIRDYMDVRDCVRAIHLVLEKGEPNQAYNISSGVGRRISDLVERANHALGYTGKIGEQDVPEFHKVVQTPVFVADNSKLKALGYEPQYDINTTVEEIAHYYSDQWKEQQRLPKEQS